MKTEWNHNRNHSLNNNRKRLQPMFWRRGLLRMHLHSFTSRKSRQGKGKPLQSLSTIVSLLESALREEWGLLQHEGSWEFGDSKLRHFKTSFPWNWAGFYRWGRRDLGSLLLWDWPYHQGRFHERWQTTSLPWNSRSQTSQLKIGNGFWVCWNTTSAIFI